MLLITASRSVTHATGRGVHRCMSGHPPARLPRSSQGAGHVFETSSKRLLPGTVRCPHCSHLCPCPPPQSCAAPPCCGWCCSHGPSGCRSGCRTCTAAPRRRWTVRGGGGGGKAGLCVSRAEWRLQGPGATHNQRLRHPIDWSCDSSGCAVRPTWAGDSTAMWAPDHGKLDRLTPGQRACTPRCLVPEGCLIRMSMRMHVDMCRCASHTACFAQLAAFSQCRTMTMKTERPQQQGLPPHLTVTGRGEIKPPSGRSNHLPNQRQSASACMCK